MSLDKANGDMTIEAEQFPLTAGPLLAKKWPTHKLRRGLEGDVYSADFSSFYDDTNSTANGSSSFIAGTIELTKPGFLSYLLH